MRARPRTSPRRPAARRIAAAALAAGLTALLAGCATGFNAETNRDYAAAVGNNSFEGDVDILNALYVTNPDGTATLSGSLLDRVSTGDTLTAIAVDREGVQATLVAPVDLEPSVSFMLGSGSEPEVVLSGDALEAGVDLATTFTFADAGAVVVQVPVVERTAVYRDVPAPALPTPTDDATDDPAAEDTAPTPAA